jgi:hypothetical protein
MKNLVLILFFNIFLLGKCDIVSGPPRAKNPVPPPSVYLLFSNFVGKDFSGNVEREFGEAPRKFISVSHDRVAYFTPTFSFSLNSHGFDLQQQKIPPAGKNRS